MGIAIMVLYLPLYLISSIISIVSARIIHRNIVKSGFSDKAIIMYKVLGFIIAIIFTWILILLVPIIMDISGNTLFKEKVIRAVIQLALTLIAPIIPVLIAHLLFLERKREKYFSVGVLLSIPVMPWVTFFPFSYL